MDLEAAIACLQAEEQGLLVGNLNAVQIIARSVRSAFDARKDEVAREESFNEKQGIIDLYIKLNFPKVYEEIERRRFSQPDDEVKLDEISADSMDEMIGKLRAAAGMS